jgi:phosphate transport system substrate-binding protein
MRVARVLSGLSCLAILSGCSVDKMAGSVTTQSFVIQGSDTEVQLVSSLVEAFAAGEPDVELSVTGGGSAVGIAALLNGDADIANSSRPLNEKERALAAEKGMRLGEFILARDGLSVIVHPSNPLKEASVEQVGAIFRGDLTNWKDLGGDDAPIVLYGRQSTSGTFGFFRDAVVKADYASSLRQMEGSQAIVDAVVSDVNGIGYVGVGYVKGQDGSPRTDVAALSVSPTGGEPASPLDVDAVLSGRYPISRPIFQYLATIPEAGSPLDRFIRFEASPAGLSIVESMGFYPPSVADKQANEEQLGIE